MRLLISDSYSSVLLFRHSVLVSEKLCGNVNDTDFDRVIFFLFKVRHFDILFSISVYTILSLDSSVSIVRALRTSCL
jgi:hypothetical protein